MLVQCRHLQDVNDARQLCMNAAKSLTSLSTPLDEFGVSDRIVVFLGAKEMI